MMKRRFKKITAIVLVVAMTCSMTGCEKGKITDASKMSQGKNDTKVQESTEDAAKAAEAKKEQEEFDIYLQESFEEAACVDTITFHSMLTNPEKYGITMPEVTLGEFDFSEEGFAEDKKELEDDIKELKEFDYELLTEEQQLTYDIMLDWGETKLLSFVNPYFCEPFSYSEGLQNNFPILMSNYEFYDEDDVKDYLALLNQVPDCFTKCLDFEKTKSEKGYFMCDENVDTLIEQCQDYINDPENNMLIQTFNDRIGDVPGMTPEKIEEYKKQNYDAVMNKVIPAYQNVIDTFTSLKGTCTKDAGLASYDGGKEYYEYILKSKLGTDKTPEEIIERLESEMAVEREMDRRIFNGEIEGVTVENLTKSGDKMEIFEVNLGTEYGGGVSDPEKTIKTLEEMCDDKFPDIPEINFTVSPIHESLAGNVSPAFYMSPSLDAYQKNKIYADIGPDAWPIEWGMCAHEGVPGHIYQFNYFLSSDPDSMRYALCNMGYVEGWATYVEMMSYDYYDIYADDNYAPVGKSMARKSLLELARLDLGINYEGWSLEETIEYVEKYNVSCMSVPSTYNFLKSEPGYYQPYATGMLEFEELKTYTKEQLGEHFDELEFHKVVLDAGPCQFSILRSLVEEYVMEKAKKSGIVIKEEEESADSKESTEKTDESDTTEKEQEVVDSDTTEKEQEENNTNLEENSEEDEYEGRIVFYTH